MPSPFPGMNPYLEQEGMSRQFHRQFCTHCLEMLVPQVRPHYIVDLSPSADIERLSTIIIRDRLGRAIVTAIELLSPANKESDRQQYLRKRDEYIAAGVCLVEIDLLRGGRRLPIDDAPPCDYYVMVAKPSDSPRVGLWPIELAQRLPKIPIPLRPPHADAHLDLQEILHHLYDGGGYADYIYSSDPRPPLSAEQSRWAQELFAR